MEYGGPYPLCERMPCCSTEGMPEHLLPTVYPQNKPWRSLEIFSFCILTILFELRNCSESDKDGLG
uniref:Uncharacterized protein n=1 Tax=Ficedula albicollis TaxID=59894 RepID=A0A803WE87_FICAL